MNTNYKQVSAKLFEDSSDVGVFCGLDFCLLFVNEKVGALWLGQTIPTYISNNEG